MRPPRAASPRGSPDGREREAPPPLPNCPLLVPKRPLLLMPRLAVLIGLDQAIILQQVRYWLGDDRQPHVRDGRRWVYKSYPQWQRQHLPFFSLPTIKRRFRDLERAGLLLAGTFGDDPFDRTKWYTVDFDRLLELEQEWAARPATDPRRAARRGVVRAPRMPDPTLPPIPGSNLLIDADPLLINVALAAHLGFNEAIIVQQLYYWLGDDRRPLTRDGRRWVARSYAEWRERDFPFWSERTIQDAFLGLERRGVLVANCFATRGGDRTKWYSIDFDRLTAIATSVANFPSPADGIKIALSSDQNCAISGRDQYCATGGSELRADDAGLIPSPYKIPSETPTEIPIEKEQQQPLQTTSSPVQDAVVVVDQSGLIQALTERGITATVARRLGERYPTATVARQLDIFDWLRDEAPDNEKLVAGRLRRMIEEDWVPPPGWEPVAARAERTRAATAAERRAQLRHELWLADEAERREREAMERRETLAAIGVIEEDQVTWRRVVEEHPRPASYLREAFFYAPRDGEPAVIILREHADWELIRSPRGARERAEIERRLATLFRRPVVEVAYAPYDLIAKMLAGDDGEFGGAT